jgi:hypothetical protein
MSCPIFTVGYGGTRQCLAPTAYPHFMGVGAQHVAPAPNIYTHYLFWHHKQEKNP